MNFEQARSNMVLNQLRANRIRNSSLIEKIDEMLSTSNVARIPPIESSKNL